MLCTGLDISPFRQQQSDISPLTEGMEYTTPFARRGTHSLVFPHFGSGFTIAIVLLKKMPYPWAGPNRPGGSPRRVGRICAAPRSCWRAQSNPSQCQDRKSHAGTHLVDSTGSSCFHFFRKIPVRPKWIRFPPFCLHPKIGSTSMGFLFIS